MNLTFINVGYGEAIWIECPCPEKKGMFTILIDGGSNLDAEYADCSAGRIRLLDYLKQSGADHIDVMILTHIHEDHVCGLLPAAREFPPGEVWQGLPGDFHSRLPSLSRARPENPDRAKFADALRDWQSLLSLAEEQKSLVRTLKAGDRIDPCPGMQIQVLAPSAQREKMLITQIEDIFFEKDTEQFFRKLSALDNIMNNFSLFLRLDYGGRKILLPGDTNASGYDGIPREALKADLFKVGHHGQRDGADETILKAIHPEILVCCASSDRRYGSACPELMKTAWHLGAEIYCSDCPPLPEPLSAAPSHIAVRFRFEEGQPVRAEYLGREGEVLDEKV